MSSFRIRSGNQDYSFATKDAKDAKEKVVKGRSNHQVSHMKRIIAIVLSSTAIAATAADFPAKPARIIVPIGPGSSMDIVGRVLAQKLTEAWNQSVIVDNRAGAGGNIGADLVAKSAPDGYTILFASSSFEIGRAHV